MGDDSYNILLSKYNRLIARFRDLEKQMEEKEAVWKEMEQNFRINESLARELCELVLAKEPREMVLGSEYSWGKLDLRTLLQKSKVVFASYNDSRTQLLKTIQETAEERRLQIESLKLQISSSMQELRSAPPLPTAKSEPEPQPESSPPPVVKKEVPAETMRRVNYNMQQAAKEGALEIQLIEEDGDVSLSDIAQQQGMAKLGEVISLERSGIKISPSARKQRAVEQERKRVVEAMMVDVGDIRERMNERKWLVLEVIGSTGYYERSQLKTAFIDLYKKRNDSDRKITDGGFSYELKNLVDLGVLILDTNIQHPLKSNFGVYSLSEIGKRLYEQQFGKKPVASERDTLIAQHDNLEHGLGIKTLKEIMEATGSFSSVTMDRQTNTIHIDDSTTYIPDIIARDKAKGFTMYLEYERDTHNQSNFNIKLNKMAKVTKYLNIVAPNLGTAEGLIAKVDKWIELRGGHKGLRGIRVRITTLKRLEGAASINDDRSWYAVYNLNESATPVIQKGDGL